MLAFVPESLPHALRSQDKGLFSAGGPTIPRNGAGPKQLLKELHPRQILDVLLPSSKIAERSLRVNLICLASINTLMFGCALGSMSILMLYPQVSLSFSYIHARDLEQEHPGPRAAVTTIQVANSP